MAAILSRSGNAATPHGVRMTEMRVAELGGKFGMSFDKCKVLLLLVFLTLPKQPRLIQHQ